jgi:hypothetical protein
MFSITPKVKEMAKASSIEYRQELAITIALAALNVALSDEPVRPSERQIERREVRAAYKRFADAVAGLAWSVHAVICIQGRVLGQRCWNVGVALHHLRLTSQAEALAKRSQGLKK